MLTMVEVRTRRGNLLSLPLDDDSSGYRVADIEGLGPVKATLVSSDFAGVDGAQYQSARREARNIKIKLELDPDPSTTDTVETLRDRLYNYFMPKTEDTLRFIKENGLEVDIVGRVESCDPNYFAQEPTIDISIMCFKPDLIDLTPAVVTGMFTSDGTAKFIDYVGTVETGMEIAVDVNRTISGFTVYHTPPGDSIQTLDFIAPLIAGDVVTISTVSGSRGATLVRAGVESSLLYGVSPQSKWIEFQPGTNQLRVYTPGAGMAVTVTYINRYGAV